MPYRLQGLSAVPHGSRCLRALRDECRCAREVGSERQALSLGVPRLIALLLARRLEGHRGWLRRRTTACHGLYFLNLEVETGLFPCLLAVTLIFLVHVQYQFLHVVARYGVLVEVARADAEMQGFVALLLSGAFLEAGTLAAEPQLDDLLLVVVAGALAADLDDALHVAALGADEPPSHLEVLIVVDLNVEAARVLYVIVVRRRLLLLLRSRPGRGLEARCLEHVSIAEASACLWLLSGGRQHELGLLLERLDHGDLLVFLILRVDYPLYGERRVVFVQIEVVKRLLSHESRDDVCELNQSEALGGLDAHVLYVSEHLEDL